MKLGLAPLRLGHRELSNDIFSFFLKRTGDFIKFGQNLTYDKINII